MTEARDGRPAVLLAAGVLVLLFLAQVWAVAEREGMTYDEGFHTYAGVRYWQCGDFGVNPEHPPLAKMVAALPLVAGRTPMPAEGCPVRDATKGAGYADSTAWLFGDGGGQAARADVLTTLPKARHAMSVFALLLAVTVFGFTRRLYGDAAALVALGLLAFEPTLIAHGGLVTTDMAMSALALLAVAAFYAWERRPAWWRLAGAGVACGLALAVKHSGVLIVPVLGVLAGCEAWARKREGAGRVAGRQAAALLAVFAVGLAVLWATYHFRYAARPGGARLGLSLVDFIADTKAKDNRSLLLRAIPGLARMRLLPEAYLYGFVDVLSISNPGQSSFLFGHLYPHGVPQYFPAVVLIKSTLGMLGLGVLSVWAVGRRGFRLSLGTLYLAVPMCVWMAAGMVSTLNIGYRHVLPVIAPACCLMGAGAVLLWRRGGRGMRVALGVLLAAHAGSSLAAYPNELAYANEAFGGVRNVHTLLTDSNVDWGQGTPQLAEWLEARGIGTAEKPCWFAYDGAGYPSHYGIRCHSLPPNLFEPNTAGGGEAVPMMVTGTFVISGLSGSGIEWERPDLNPYEGFRRTRPVAVVAGADVVYEGTYDLRGAVAVQGIVDAMDAVGKGRFTEALERASRSAGLMPTSALAHLERAHALKGLGRTAEAHAEYATADGIAEAQPQWYFLFLPEMRAGLKATTP